MYPASVVLRVKYRPFWKIFKGRDLAWNFVLGKNIQILNGTIRVCIVCVCFCVFGMGEEGDWFYFAYTGTKKSLKISLSFNRKVALLDWKNLREFFDNF